MIYTVTFNPAIDYVMHPQSVVTGAVNRSAGEDVYFGGKGLNVSYVLKELGIPSKALGFTAGFTGAVIEQLAQEAGIDTDLIWLSSGMSRINVKLRADEETEINGRGPDIPQEAIEELFVRLEALQDGDVLVLAGSIPSTLPADIYEQILSRLSGKKIKAVVDASGALLRNVLKYRPYLVKPNDHELGELFGVTLTTTKEIAEYASKLQEMGAVSVLVSRAEKGALLLDEHGKLHTCGVFSGTVKNSVGAGDSMVAGFLAGIEKGYGYALRLGTAAGGATAFSDGLAEGADIHKLMEQDSTIS